MDLALVIGLATLGVGLIGHIVTTVWWASKITNILENAQKSLNELSIDMKSVNKTYVSKEDFARELGHVEKRLDAAWAKLDALTGQ
ncbi:MAG TPA: hypothetical protein V6D12_14225 [Candidatus Obscuribacterales bacterium]